MFSSNAIKDNFLDLELSARHLFNGGLMGSAVHEFRAPEAMTGHVAFAILLLTRLPKSIPILWVSAEPTTYPPGLAWLGMDPARCLFARARDDVESLGTLEAALLGGMAGVVECEVVSRLAARRLALAAKRGGSVGFLLRHAPAFTPTDSTAFATRWLITPAPSPLPDIPRLRAELLYSKNGQPGEFQFDISEVNHGAASPAFNLVEQEAEAEQPRRTG